MPITAILEKYGDFAFGKLTELFNWVFEYENENYEQVGVEWIEDNISIRMLVNIVKEIAEQNRMGWLLPFFQSKMMETLRQ